MLRKKLVKPRKRFNKILRKEENVMAKGGKKLCKYCKSEMPWEAKICPNCKKKQGGIIKWVVITVIILGIIGSFNKGSKNKPADIPENTTVLSQINDTLNSNTEDNKGTETAEINEDDKSDKINAEAENENDEPLGFNVMFSKTYRNDATGNWRLARIAENINIEDYAIDYYNNYFESDSEIHIIINFTLNTTTRITVMGNILDVCIMDYVDKEEHDASLACSGTLLKEYHVNIDTDEITEIQ